MSLRLGSSLIASSSDNKMDTDLSNLTDTGKGVIDSRITDIMVSQKSENDSLYVKLDGNETINGEKTFTNKIKTSQIRALTGEDENNKAYGTVEFYDNGTDNKTCLFVFDEEETANANIILHYNNGEPYVTAPASSKLGSVVTTTGISKSQNGYVKLGNGIILQWRFNSLSSDGTTITFPTSFTSTNYGIAICGHYSAKYNDFGCRLGSMTSSNFKAYRTTALNGMRWVAMGY
jgi:hypothetical protein